MRIGIGIDRLRYPPPEGGGQLRLTALAIRLAENSRNWYAVRRFQEGGMRFSRRDFLSTTALGSLALGLEAQEEKTKDSRGAEAKTQASKRPIIICAANGLNYLDEGFELLRGGADTLDAALRVVRGPEDDPNDSSVGLGGLPNEEGVVELDACCMHGPTRRAGSVGGVRNITNVAPVSPTGSAPAGQQHRGGEAAAPLAVDQGPPS